VTITTPIHETSRDVDYRNTTALVREPRKWQLSRPTSLNVSTEEAQYDLIRRLQEQGILPREIAQLFSEVRRAGNAASHALVGDHRTALAALKITWQIGVWFHRIFKNPAFKSGAFIPPQAPQDESDDLRAELAQVLDTFNDALWQRPAA